MQLELRLRSFIPAYYDLTLSIRICEEPNEAYYSLIRYTCKQGKIASVKHDLPPDIETLLPLVLDVIGKPKAVLMKGMDTYNLIYQ